VDESTVTGSFVKGHEVVEFDIPSQNLYEFSVPMKVALNVTVILYSVKLLPIIEAISY
jgi:hypothetical protein